MEREVRDKNINTTQTTFAGDLNEDVTDWIFNMDQNMKAARIREKEKVIVASMFIRLLIESKPTLTWEELKTELTKRFKRRV